MKKSKDNCTAMIVGKKATIDGSTIIARDEDGYGGINEKLFVVHEAKDYDEDYVSKYNGMAASGLLHQQQMLQKVAGMSKELMNIT
mgnify:CR=1 FL=1